MRKLEDSGTLRARSSEVFSVLRLCAVNEPLLPNLKALELWRVDRDFISFIPLFLSPRITAITIWCIESDSPKAIVASVITTFPRLSPNLQDVTLYSIPRDPMIAAAVSGMPLTNGQNHLRCCQVDTPLTEEAHEVIFKLPHLRVLSVVIERDTLPTVVLPGLTGIHIEYDHDHDWLQGFRGATLGKLASATFFSESKSIGDFLKAFESVALTTSIPATLSIFRFHTSRPWSPNYRSLLPFTQLKEIIIDFSCERSCSSTIDDDTITDIAREIPGPEILQLGDPCQTPTGVTAEGLAALARYCPHLSTLRIHFQAYTLDLPATPGAVQLPDGEPTIQRKDCALTDLEVGKILVPEESTLTIAQTLLRIFPRIDRITYLGDGWGEIMDAIEHFKQLADLSGKDPSPPLPRSK